MMAASAVAIYKGAALAASLNPGKGKASSHQAATPMSENQRELRDFDEFLDSHPVTAQSLRAQVGLVEQPKFQENHPDLMKFLDTHHGVRDQLLGHPYWFIRREHHYEELKQYDHRLTRAELGRFDGYLERHPEVAKALQSNPRLLDDATYLKEHNELRNFMVAHPQLAIQMQSHPQWFMTAADSSLEAGGINAAQSAAAPKAPMGHGNQR